MATQTIAQLHGLETDDPWDRRNDGQKFRDAARQELRDTHRPSKAETTFVDPPDDADLVIRVATDRVFHRVSVTCKLGELLKLEPSLLTIGVAARNTSGGCWVALTSRRVASQIAHRLQAQGLSVELAIVSSDGQPIDYALSDEQREIIHRGFG